MANDALAHQSSQFERDCGDGPGRGARAMWLLPAHHPVNNRSRFPAATVSSCRDPESSIGERSSPIEKVNANMEGNALYLIKWDIKRGMLQAIIQQTGLSVKEFLNL
jgi:hypothetical protein